MWWPLVASAWKAAHPWVTAKARHEMEPLRCFNLVLFYTFCHKTTSKQNNHRINNNTNASQVSWGDLLALKRRVPVSIYGAAISSIWETSAQPASSRTLKTRISAESPSRQANIKGKCPCVTASRAKQIFTCWYSRKQPGETGLRSWSQSPREKRLQMRNRYKQTQCKRMTIVFSPGLMRENTDEQ